MGVDSVNVFNQTKCKSDSDNMQNIDDNSSDFESKNLSKLEVQIVKKFCQKLPAEALKFGSKIDTQTHLVSQCKSSGVT